MVEELAEGEELFVADVAGEVEGVAAVVQGKQDAGQVIHVGSGV